MAEPTKARCACCGAVASNLITYRAEAALIMVTTCDNAACLESARQAATADDHATITRIRNYALLFHLPSLRRQPDHEPPFTCASCRQGRHSQCDNQVAIRQGGQMCIVPCDCYRDLHKPGIGSPASPAR